jgi:Flp pilus assembly protein TadG
LRRILDWCAGDSSGNVTPIIAILLVPLVGVMGLAVETSNWYLTQRNMQHAADSAAMAAAISNVATGDQDYLEARAVAANFGYVDGAQNVTVTPLRGQTCPVPQQAASDCYKVTITKNLAINLVRLVGYQGDVAMGAGRAKTVTTVSMARPRTNFGDVCFIGLGTSGDDLRVNGGGNSIDWNGCSVLANSDLTCNGSHSADNLAGGFSATNPSAGSTPCGSSTAVVPAFGDPYSYIAPLIPDDNCSGAYAGESIPAGTNTTAWPNPRHFCGNVTLQGNLPINNPNQVLVIHRGDLNIGNFTLSTASTGSLTIMFEGNVGATARTITGSGVVDFAAPTEGPLHGVAWVQDPDMASSSPDFGGTSPTINVTGLVYMPKADLTVSGNIHFHTGGFDCFALVANSFRANGNITIIEGANSQCPQAGVATPTVPLLGIRAALVQ